MPQMAPMNWMFFYFLFTITFLIFYTLIYFFFLKKNTLISNKNYLHIYNNWKW